MKKLLFHAALLMVINLVFSQAVFAQENKSPEDILIGKWNLTVKDLAAYDINLLLDVKKNESALLGEVSIPGVGEPPNKFPEIVLTESSFSVEIVFDAFLGVPLPLVVTVKDENSLKGTLFGYNLEGKRAEQ